MSIVAIRAALETHLNGLTPAIDTAYENVPYAPKQGTPYQQLFLRTATPENPSIGALRYRELGYMQSTLRYPLKAGSAPAMTRAEAIRTRFARGTTLTKDGCVVHIPVTPTIIVLEAEPEWFLVAVRIDWHCNLLAS